MKYLNLIYLFLILMLLCSCAGSGASQQASQNIGPQSFTLSFDGNNWTQTFGNSVCNIDTSNGLTIVITLCAPTDYTVFVNGFGQNLGGQNIGGRIAIETSTQITFLIMFNGLRVAPSDPVLTGSAIIFAER